DLYGGSQVERAEMEEARLLLRLRSLRLRLRGGRSLDRRLRLLRGDRGGREEKQQDGGGSAQAGYQLVYPSARRFSRRSALTEAGAVMLKPSASVAADSGASRERSTSSLGSRTRSKSWRRPVSVSTTSFCPPAIR